MDWYGEVYIILVKILEGVFKVLIFKLVLNGDEFLLGKFNIKNLCVYYGFNILIKENVLLDLNVDVKFCKFCKVLYSYNLVIYNYLGDFYCFECGYKWFDLFYVVNKIFDLIVENFFVLINFIEIFIS